MGLCESVITYGRVHPDNAEFASVPSGNLIIEFISIENSCAVVDDSCQINPYIVAHISTRIDGTDKRISQKIKTIQRQNNSNPILHSYQNFYIKAPKMANLNIMMYDYDLTNKHDLLGTIIIPLSDLDDEKVHSLELKPTVNKNIVETKESTEMNSNFKINLRRKFLLKPPPGRKTFFIIRHGESEWNHAQEHVNISGMVGQNDHTLTVKGIMQAMELNMKWNKSSSSINNLHLDIEKLQLQSVKSEMLTTVIEEEENEDDDNDIDFNSNYMAPESTAVAEVVRSYSKMPFASTDRRQVYTEQFQNATEVFSSPLTRAIQTALVALDGHKAFTEKGLTLYSVIREVKGPGGMDTVGVKYGADIIPRVADRLEAVIGQPATARFMKTPIHINDANMPWWTPQSMSDSKEEVQRRVDDFLNFIRYSEVDTPIFVGHSLFFKAMYNCRISKALEANRPELAANMKKYKLDNANVMAITVGYIDNEDGETKPGSIILDADILFDGNLQVPKHMQSGKEETIRQAALA
eukprot:gene6382-12905_t